RIQRTRPGHEVTPEGYVVTSVFALGKTGIREHLQKVISLGAKSSNRVLSVLTQVRQAIRPLERENVVLWRLMTRVIVQRAMRRSGAAHSTPSS
ncbi:unnamed protein product, partial [Discosporangium mesarthrocarpum]